RRGVRARRRGRADHDPSPTHALGLVLDQRDAVVQLATCARAARRSRLRRRPRALPPARPRPLAALLAARREPPAGVAAAARLADGARARAARVSPRRVVFGSWSAGRRSTATAR